MLFDSIYIKCPEQVHLQRQKVDSWLAGTQDSGEWGVTASGYGVSVGGDENILELDSGSGWTTL